VIMTTMKIFLNFIILTFIEQIISFLFVVVCSIDFCFVDLMMYFNLAALLINI